MQIAVVAIKNVFFICVQSSLRNQCAFAMPKRNGGNPASSLTPAQIAIVALDLEPIWFASKPDARYHWGTMRQLGIEPIIIGIISAAWFIFIAHRHGHRVLPWSLRGFFMGLVLAAMAMGLGHSVALPYTPEKVSANLWLAAAISFAVMGMVGGGIIAAMNDWRIKPGMAVHSDVPQPEPGAKP